MSPKYTLNQEDFKKIYIGALMAISGALLTYVTQVIGQIDFGEYTPIVVAMWSIFVNITRKYIVENK